MSDNTNTGTNTNTAGQSQSGRRRPRNRRPRNENEPRNQGAGSSRQPNQDGAGEGSNQETNRPRRRPFPKPKPKNFDKLGARGVEINQIKRRFPNHIESDNGLIYKLQLKPSDPDFAFDLDTLQFNLIVPKDYPKSVPYIQVTNEEIPKGYSANVEIGFAELAQEQLGKMSLLNMINKLDHNLEDYLTREKRATIRIVRQKKVTRKASPEAASGDDTTPKPTGAMSFNPTKVFIPGYVKRQRLEQIDLLQHRMGGTMALFSHEPEIGSTYSLTVSKSSEMLPPELQEPFRILLFIPADYNMSPCTISIPTVDNVEARNIENNFNHQAEVFRKNWSLSALMNYLFEKLDSLILPPADLITPQASPREADSTSIEHDTDTAAGHEENDILAENDEIDENEENDDNDPMPEDGEDGHKKESEASHEESANTMSEMPPLDLRGTALILPHIKLSNIGFLECQVLNLVVKCNRCKTTNDLLNLASAPYGRESKAVGTACTKCNATLAAAFRKDLIHAMNQRAGLLDFSNCTPYQLLPSTFIPTCEKCSTTLPQPFKRMELAKTANAHCHECHAKMSMFIPEFRFDLISDETEKLNVRVKRHKESLGIKGGAPLPHEGTCEHYKKSNRWFRFSCCGKVYPCDRCHDAKADHPTERAHRMICGACSREQNFSERCIYCAEEFSHKRSPFWNGGTGTRNRVLMSKKDTRKYKRVGGTSQ
ncbi:hypothetical protein TRVA0_036S00320 [Trichomonascus vanleenenianus]|uniref:uncharacterized protein n=1 Tax=Trichomonascus vanleenenianus TaxID=2268995 RepID=UPI003ECB48AC